MNLNGLGDLDEEFFADGFVADGGLGFSFSGSCTDQPEIDQFIRRIKLRSVFCVVKPTRHKSHSQSALTFSFVIVGVCHVLQLIV